jgi:hypothetical protein
MANSKFLGKHMGKLWICHDKRDFKKLQKNAVDLMLNLGYNKITSQKISVHIKKAYELHGVIDNKVFQNKSKTVNIQLINKQKKLVLSEMDKAFEIAGFENHKILSKYQCNWWFDFSYTHISKNKVWYVKILWHIFILQLIKFKKIFPAINATHKLCLAGIRGHNTRNNTILFNALTEYWEIVLKNDSKPFMF